MKGNRDVINQLNQVLYHHLTAINQYFLHSRMFNDWGIEQLGSAEYKESIRQMKHAEENIEAIQKAVILAEQQLDYVTRDLVQEILEKEEEYLDWATTQLDLVETVGIENYIQSQI